MTTLPNTNLELEFLGTFVVRPKRARYAALVVSPRLRPQFLAALRSFSHFDPRFKVRLPPSQDSTKTYLAELRDRGAGPSAYLISTADDLDGRSLPIAAAVDEVHGRCNGTIVICTSTLAYYEGALKYRFILDSQQR